MLDMYFDLEEDLVRFSRSMNEVQRRHLPYVMARTVTATAYDARDAVRGGLKERFTVRSKFVERGVRVQPGTKRYPVAKVGSVDWFMTDQETGAVRRPKKSRLLAIPQGIRKQKSQRIGRAKHPGALLRKEGRRRFFVNKIVRGLSAGKQAVLRRVGRERYPLQVLYVMKSSVKIRPRWRFFQTVDRTVNRKLSKNYGREYGRALRTAR